MNIAYNGGANISTLNISYRLAGSEFNWSPPALVEVTVFSSHSVEAIIDTRINKFSYLEFKVAAINSLFFQSNTVVFNETTGE